MLDWFIENGKVDQYDHAGETIWSWLFEQLVTHNLGTIFPLIGLILLFIFKPTRWFAIGALLIGILLT